MFGLLFGTLCLFGLVGAVRRFHHYYSYGGYSGSCGGGYRGSRGRHSIGAATTTARPATIAGLGRRRALLARRRQILKRRLRVKEDQEVIIDHALTDLRVAQGAAVEREGQP